MKSGKLLTQPLQGIPSMDDTVVEQDNHRTTQVTKHLVEKDTHLLLSDIVHEKHPIQSQPSAARADRYP